MKVPWLYRKILFQELNTYLNGKYLPRILEIGSKDFIDTDRLLTLKPEALTLLDLPGFEEKYGEYLAKNKVAGLEFLSANLMYDERIKQLQPYDLIWCTGVLYHNPEQLRMLKRLYDLLTEGGVLVMESATVRNPKLIDENVVEIIYPGTDEQRKKFRISKNVTHLPSKRAIQSWLELIGFEDIRKSDCYRSTSKGLDQTRGAFIARKPVIEKAGKYYTVQNRDGFEIGSSL